MIALGDTLDGTARSRSWALVALTPTYIVRPILTLVVMSIGHFTGFAPTAMTAVLSAIIATYATSLVQLFVVNHRFKKVVDAGPKTIRFGQSFAIFLVEGFFFLLTNADALMVGALPRPRERCDLLRHGQAAGARPLRLFLGKGGRGTALLRTDAGQRSSRACGVCPRHGALDVLAVIRHCHPGSRGRQTTALSLWRAVYRRLSAALHHGDRRRRPRIRRSGPKTFSKWPASRKSAPWSMA